MKSCAKCGRSCKGYKCTPCGVLQSAHGRAYYRRVKAAGLCVRCRCKREQANRSLCNRHLAELLAKQIERKKKAKGVR